MPPITSSCEVGAHAGAGLEPPPHEAGPRPSSRRSTRSDDGLSEEQVARNVQQAVLQKLGSPSEDDVVMELSEEDNYLDGSRVDAELADHAARRSWRAPLPGAATAAPPAAGPRRAGRPAAQTPRPESRRP